MTRFCLLTLVALAVLISTTVSSKEKREAQSQTCVGSQCSQNNLNQSPFTTGHGIQTFQGFGPFGGFGLGLGGHGGYRGGYGGGYGGGGGGLGGFVGQQLQNCVGSQCQQNNRNVGGAGGGGSALLMTSQTQNCLGSQCQQTNQNVPAGLAFGRKKRATGEEEEEGATNVPVDKRRNLTVRKISSEDEEGERKKRSSPGSSGGLGGERRKYTRRVVRTEARPSHQEADQDLQSQSDITNLLTSDAFLDKVISFRYLDDDTH